MMINQQSPSVSVIVPVYDAERFLSDAVESILDQSFRDWELLLVDDCSPDRSGEICRDFEKTDPVRIRYIRHPENRGVSAARNTGLDNARGRYIVFLDADDRYFSDALEVLVATAETSPKAGIVAGEFIHGRSPEEGTVVASGKPTRSLSPEEALEMVLYQHPELDHSPWAKLYRRELFDGLRFREGIKFEDMEIFPKLLRKSSSVILLGRPVYFYRENPASFMNTWNRARLDALAVTDSILADVRRESPALVSAARSLRLSAYFTSFIHSSLHGLPDVPDRTWKVIRRERLAGLADPKVRLKNKVGILLTFFGRRGFLAVASRLRKFRGSNRRE